ncbi:hypothetical protein D9M68_977790 [compost metagenome]
MAIIVLDGRNGIGPGRRGLHGFELPPIRIDADVIKLLDQDGRGPVIHGACLGWNDLEQEFQGVPAGCCIEPLHYLFLLSPHFRIVIGMAEG